MSLTDFVSWALVAVLAVLGIFLIWMSHKTKGKKRITTDEGKSIAGIGICAAIYNLFSDGDGSGSDNYPDWL